MLLVFPKPDTMVIHFISSRRRPWQWWQVIWKLWERGQGHFFRLLGSVGLVCRSVGRSVYVTRCDFRQGHVTRNRIPAFIDRGHVTRYEVKQFRGTVKKFKPATLQVFEPVPDSLFISLCAFDDANGSWLFPFMVVCMFSHAPNDVF